MENKLKAKVTYLRPEDKVCPKCGSQHIQNVSRITGYLSMDERFGAGKVAERDDRVAHNKKVKTKVYTCGRDC